MNGAQLILSTLASNGIEVTFANPGTSEMHFVAALESVPEMRGVLGLFEGVVTGAADGYGRISGKPAATLLHLGPGLANGLANLHNARRARTPIVNLVGDHATYHKRYDPPLESDIESLATPMSGWVHSCAHPDALRTDVHAAIGAAWGPPRRVATLIVPADISWLPAETPVGSVTPLNTHNGRYAQVQTDVIEGVAKALRAPGRSALLLGGTALRRRSLEAAARICASTGAKLLGETFPAVMERGAGIPAVERLGYLAEFAIAQLEGISTLVIVDTNAPVSFFAYPDKPSDLVPAGCAVHVLATGSENAPGALESLADLMEEPGSVPPDDLAAGHGAAGSGVSSAASGSASASAVMSERPAAPTGVLNAKAVGDAVGYLLPEGAVVSDESNTAGIYLNGATAGCPPHEWMCLTGGSIGQGMPVATGAAIAIAGQGRRVLSLQADGSAMYTFQSLWTQARESLDVTTVIFQNHSYAILELELARVGAAGAAGQGPIAKSMLNLDPPDIDFVSLSKGMGVPASKATTAEEFTELLGRSINEPGPSVIVADIGRGIG
ncbi:MAG: acetolactate synthase large subunit [Acidimicrobiales bacterium]